MKKNTKKLIILSSIALSLFSISPTLTFAEDSSSTLVGATASSTASSTLTSTAVSTTTAMRAVTLTIRNGNSVVWSGSVSVPDSDIATTTITATNGTNASAAAASVLSALVSADAARPEFSISNLQYFSSFGSFYLKCVTASTTLCDNWQYVVNNVYPSIGMDSYVLHDGDAVYVYFGPRRRVSLSAPETVPTIPVVARVESYNYTDDSWSALAGETVGATTPNPSDPFNPVVAFSAISDANGLANLTLTATSSYNVGLASEFYSTTLPLTVRTLAPNEVAIRIRNGVNLAYQGIAAISTTTVSINATDGSAHNVSGTTPLAVLVSADSSSTAFNISNLQYFSSFGSFYVKCITLSSSSVCDNWQYAVNGVVPGVGADAYNLSGGENIFFFYGYPRRVSLSSSTAVIGSSVTATAETYNPSSDTYVAASGLTIGATQPNPGDPFSPIEIATSTAGQNGRAVFTLNATGTYQFGIKEDFYFPSADFTIISAPQIPASGGGTAHYYIDINKASQFLFNHELSDGSFGSPLYTDWAAIALVSSSGNSTNNISAYLKTANGSMSVATDYERHAMALMALGINPYDGATVNYIQKIIDTFDGTQIGDTGLVNDDIFSIFPLMKAGYSSGDPMIAKIISFIISKQTADGSWESSVDLTAAAIQALSLNTGIGGASDAISKARAYLVARQNSDGGFGTSFSTSWVLQAIAAMNESGLSWIKNNKNPYDYLYGLQAIDGGIENASTDLNSRIWATSYAIPASLNKTWFSLLASFPKQAPKTAVSANVGGGLSGGGSSISEKINLSTSTSATASTTVSVVTSTVASTASTTLKIEATSSTKEISTSTVFLAAAAVEIQPIPAPAPALKIISSPNGGRPSVAITAQNNLSLGEVKPAVFPVFAPPQKSPDNTNKGAGQKIQANLIGLAGAIGTIGNHLLNFAANIGNLIVSKFFSIINLFR